MQKIIFLDMDGPVINTPLYSLDIHCSMMRSVLNTSALGWVVRLARETEALIVTNSAHNYHDVQTMTLRDDLVRFKVPLELFHTDWRTIYPDVRGDGPRRLMAIVEWEERNGKANWIAYDDAVAEYGTSDRLIPIDFDEGITKTHYLQGMHKLDFGG